MESDINNIIVPFEPKIKSVEKLYLLKNTYKAEKTTNGVKITLPEKFCAILLEVK